MTNTSEHGSQYLKDWEANNRREKENRRKRFFFDHLGGARAFGYLLENFPRKKILAYHAAIRFDPTKENFYFWGPSWVGKTHLATAIAHKFFDLGFDVFVTSVKDFKEKLLQFKEGFSSDARRKYIDQLINAHVLVIHELGRDPLTDYVREELFHVIDRRILAGRNGLIATGNFGFPLLGKWAEGALFERLKDLFGIRGVIEFPARNLEGI